MIRKKKAIKLNDSYFAMIKFSAPPPAPASFVIAEIAPAVADVAAAFVPVFFFVEELFVVLLVEVVVVAVVEMATSSL